MSNSFKVHAFGTSNALVPGSIDASKTAEQLNGLSSLSSLSFSIDLTGQAIGTTVNIAELDIPDNCSVVNSYVQGAGLAPATGTETKVSVGFSATIGGAGTNILASTLASTLNAGIVGLGTFNTPVALGTNKFLNASVTAAAVTAGSLTVKLLLICPSLI